MESIVASTTKMREPELESVRSAMDQAWRDHHHARDQTWKAVQIEAVLGAGLITIDVQHQDPIATIVAGALVVLVAIFGVLISLHHRKLEVRKLKHIMNCEEFLGLRRKDLLPGVKDDPQNGVKAPMPIALWDVVNLRQWNTAVFIGTGKV